MKILERAIQKENERTSNNNIDPFENSKEGDCESKHCYIKESQEDEMKSTLVDQVQEI